MTFMAVSALLAQIFIMFNAEEISIVLGMVANAASPEWFH